MNFVDVLGKIYEEYTEKDQSDLYYVDKNSDVRDSYNVKNAKRNGTELANVSLREAVIYLKQNMVLKSSLKKKKRSKA